MKRYILVVATAALFAVSAVAQSTPTVVGIRGPLFTINGHLTYTPEAGFPAISQRGARRRVKSLWERDFCVKRQGAHFCACFFRHFGHENP